RGPHLGRREAREVAHQPASLRARRGDAVPPRRRGRAQERRGLPAEPQEIAAPRVLDCRRHLAGCAVAETKTPRQELLDEIAADAADTAQRTGRARFSPRTMAAMAKVPREDFVRPMDEDSAYLNMPLPIGYGQTISQ